MYQPLDERFFHATEDGACVENLYISTKNYISIEK